METIALILFVILAIVSSAGKKRGRKAPPDLPETARTPADPPHGRSGRGNPRAVLIRNAAAKAASIPAAGMPTPPAAAGEGEALFPEDACPGGSMPHTHHQGQEMLEDEECSGGSMAHDHTEGISRREHARRLAAMDAQQQESALLQETIDREALRRAVVMAEVLGKPRALKRRSF